MYAIVDIAGQQFKVEKEQKVFINRLNVDEGKKIEFDQVLLIDNNGKVNIGSPTIKGASISAQVLSHVRGDKVLVFKKKRRKGYQKLNGHRQDLSEIVIEEINEKSTGKKAVKEEVPDAPKPGATKGETKTEESKQASAKTEVETTKKKETKPKAEKSEPATKQDKPVEEEKKETTEAKAPKAEEKKGVKTETEKEDKKAAADTKKAKPKAENKPSTDELKNEGESKEEKKEE